MSCQLIKSARDVNDYCRACLRMIKSATKDIENPIVTILGVAYRAMCPTRETPAHRIIKLAENEGIHVRCHDPLVKHFERTGDLNEATSNSDCVVLVTDHDVFRTINPLQLAMRNKNLIDTRNCLDHDMWVGAGFTVKVLGNSEMLRPVPEIEATQVKGKPLVEQRITS